MADLKDAHGIPLRLRRTSELKKARARITILRDLLDKTEATLDSGRFERISSLGEIQTEAWRLDVHLMHARMLDNIIGAD